ncbi:MAG: hypothetical protein H6741_13195 [Alphaproteobacteria bacterium]|nr:hypothetical protein [Alphaproteobacteria bacterium]MCB9793672.1 hypothetical protein [Alphaproteobacteria bacterium]
MIAALVGTGVVAALAEGPRPVDALARALDLRAGVLGRTLRFAAGLGVVPAVRARGRGGMRRGVVTR